MLFYNLVTFLSLFLNIFYNFYRFLIDISIFAQIILNVIKIYRTIQHAIFI